MGLTQITTGGVDENINIDSNTLKVDGTNNRVGIGTSSPANLLHLSSTGTPTIQITDADNSGIVKIENGSGSLFLNADTGNTVSNSRIQFGIDGSERLRIDSSGDVQARRGRSNTTGNVALSLQPSDSTIHYGLRIDAANNSLNLDRASGTATNLLRIDSSGLISQGGRVASDHGSPNLLLWGSDSTLHITSTGSVNNSSYAGIKFAVAGGSTGDYSKAGIFVERQDSYNDLDMLFAFRSSNDATGVSPSDEKMRLDSSGRLLVGTTTEGEVSADNLTIEDSGNCGITIRSGTNNVGSIYFSDATSGAGEYDGYIAYNQPSRFLQFATGQAERMRLDSSGRLLVGSTSNLAPDGFASKIQTAGTNYEGGSISIRRDQNSTSGPTLLFTKSRSSSLGGNTIVQNNDLVGQIAFYAADGGDVNQAAGWIRCFVDGTPGANDMPGRLEFHTTADGAASPAERLRITRGGLTRLLSQKGLQMHGYTFTLDNNWKDLEAWSNVSNKGGGGSILSIASNHTGTNSGKVSLTHHRINYTGGIGSSNAVQEQFNVDLRTNNSMLQVRGFDSGTGLNTTGYITLIYFDSRQHINV